MRLNIKAIEGAQIIDQKKSEVVGQVSGVVLKPKSDKVHGFTLTTGQEVMAVLFSDVKKLTEDELYIADNKSMKSLNQLISPQEEMYVLAGKPVLSKEGEQLGVVAEVFFNTKSGKLEDMVVTGTNQDMDSELLLRSKDIVSMGEDAVVAKPLSGTKKQSSSKESSEKKSKSSQGKQQKQQKEKKEESGGIKKTITDIFS